MCFPKYKKLKDEGHDLILACQRGNGFHDLLKTTGFFSEIIDINESPSVYDYEMRIWGFPLERYPFTWDLGVEKKEIISFQPICDGLSDRQYSKWDQVVFPIRTIALGSPSQSSLCPIPCEFFDGSFLEAAKIIQSSRLFVGVDSVFSNIADALGVPMVKLVSPPYYGDHTPFINSKKYIALYCKHCCDEVDPQDISKSIEILLKEI